MRQRKPAARIVPGAAAAEKARMEGAYFSAEGRGWLKKQLETINRFRSAEKKRGMYLLKKRSVRTPRVKEIALTLTHGKTPEAAARSIANYVSEKIEITNTGLQTLNRFYNTQTADDVLAAKRIPSFFGPGGPIAGCQTVSSTVAALLRAAKPAGGKISEVRVVRTLAVWGKKNDGALGGVPHTIVTFRAGGKKYVADAFNRGKSFLGSGFIGEKGRVVIAEEKIADKIARLKKEGKWKEAIDVEEFGIETFKQFLEESRKNGADLAKNLDLSQLY